MSNTVTELAKFITVKKQLIEYLANNANGCFQVVGHYKQLRNSLNIVDLPLVQVVMNGGEFDKKKATYGTLPFSPSYEVRITVSERASIDLAVLANPNALPDEIVEAIEASECAEGRADDVLDKTFALIMNLLMSVEGRNLGLSQDDVVFTDLFGVDYKKELPIKRGSLVTLTGYYMISLDTVEEPNRGKGVPLERIDTTVKHQGDVDPLKIRVDYI